MTTHPADSVRQHERIECSFRTELTVDNTGPSAGTSTQQNGGVRLSRAASAGNGTVHATLIDCSAAGLGMTLPLYLPAKCRLKVTVFDDRGTVLIEGVIRVMRAAMVGNQPSYYCGASVLSVSSGSIEALLAAARLHEPTTGTAPTSPQIMRPAMSGGKGRD